MTLAHEFKHILDYRHIDVAYPSIYGMSRHDRIEALCDYFAGCLLVPRPWLKAAWSRGVQKPSALAGLFEVTPAAIETRLLQTGLMDRGDRRRAEYRFDSFCFSHPIRRNRVGRVRRDLRSRSNNAEVVL